MVLTPDDVRAIYREFLEREAADGEVEGQLAACRTTGDLIAVVRASEEYAARLRARTGSATATPSLVNVWHPHLARWTHRPGTVSPDGIAVVGHEGWLFIKSGTNSTLVQHRGEDPPSAAWLEEWMDVMAVRRHEAGELGIALASVVVPDKLAIHEEHFPQRIDPSGPRPVLRLRERAGDALRYPLEELRASRADGDVAMRTDTHLTVHGNRVLATAVMAQLGLPAPEYPTAPGRQHEYLLSGDLGSRFVPPIHEVDRMIASLGAAEIVEDNHEAISAVGGHVGTRRVLGNRSAADPRVLVVFGDSYAFPSPHYQGLAWWLAQVFAEVHFVWVPFGWDPAYLRDAGAQVAVVQTSERFVGRVPHDRVDARALASQTIRSGRAADVDSFCRVV